MSIFDQYPVASWKAEGKEEITFSVRRIRTYGGNRLKPHKRLMKDGARHDDTGAEPIGHDLAIVIFNGNLEEGVPVDSYPDSANALMASFTVHEVGDLVVPTIGKRRARLQSFDRVEDIVVEGQDVCVMAAVFVEDNEDDAGQAAFQAPSASSAASKQAEECSDAFDESGPSLGDTLGDIRDAADDLEDFANAPGEFASDIETQANSVMEAADDLNETVTNAAAEYGEETANLFTDPGATVPGRMLNRLEDTARSAVLNKLPPPFTRIVERRYPNVVSIFAVAADVTQDPVQLMAINGGLPDLKAIPANTPIRVFG